MNKIIHFKGLALAPLVAFIGILLSKVSIFEMKPIGFVAALLSYFITAIPAIIIAWLLQFVIIVGLFSVVLIPCFYFFELSFGIPTLYILHRLGYLNIYCLSITWGLLGGLILINTEYLERIHSHYYIGGLGFVMGASTAALYYKIADLKRTIKPNKRVGLNAPIGYLTMIAIIIAIFYLPVFEKPNPTEPDPVSIKDSRVKTAINDADLMAIMTLIRKGERITLFEWFKPRRHNRLHSITNSQEMHVQKKDGPGYEKVTYGKVVVRLNEGIKNRHRITGPSYWLDKHDNEWVIVHSYLR